MVARLGWVRMRNAQASLQSETSLCMMAQKSVGAKTLFHNTSNGGSSQNSDRGVKLLRWNFISSCYASIHTVIPRKDDSIPEVY